MERAGWKSFDERLRQSKAAGKIRGIGMATYIEACAFAGSEPAHVELNADGTVTLLIGTQSNGQGHATAYAQFIAEKLNIDISTSVTMHQGDTDRLASGGGTGGSRSIPLGGVSAARAGEDLAEKIKKIAADELEASAADIELVDGGCPHRRHRPLDRFSGASPGRPKSRKTSRASASSFRTKTPIRTARISAKSRSIPRPGAPRSSPTPSSTISASR